MSYNWGAIVPLIGGLTVGNYQATKQKPNFFISFDAFKDNDAHILNYFGKDCTYISGTPENINIDEIDLPDYGDVDFMSTTCPCAGLSSLNSGNRGSDAPQNDWMLLTANLVLSKIKPKVFFGENAPALFTKSGEGVKNKLIEVGKKYGYTFSIIKTDSRLHGLPQRRQRTFYFFWRDTNPPIFKHIERPYTPLIEYLRDIPKDATYQNLYSNNDYSSNLLVAWINENQIANDIKKIFTNEGKIIKTLFHYIKRKNKFDELKEYCKDDKRLVDMLLHIQHKLSIGKNIWDNTPKLLFAVDYINAIQGRIFQHTIHPIENRYINIREYMHLMALPYDFELVSTSNLNHICQNVPVTTAKDWTDQVLQYLNGELDINENDYYEFNNIKDNIHKQAKLF